MYLIATRSFPPEVGGMQSLMWGLAKEMSKNFMIKVFADYQENHKEFDKEVNFSIERVGGIKFLRKIRKAQLINEFLKENKVQGIIADHWKSLELIKTHKKKISRLNSSKACVASQQTQQKYSPSVYHWKSFHWIVLPSLLFSLSQSTHRPFAQFPLPKYETSISPSNPQFQNHVEVVEES